MTISLIFDIAIAAILLLCLIVGGSSGLYQQPSERGGLRGGPAGQRHSGQCAGRSRSATGSRPVWSSTCWIA